ncbi:MAG: DNA polymerase III subunit delta [Nonlabens sp.]
MSTVNTILEKIKAGQYAPVYFLCGTEPYFIDQITNAVENNVLTDAEKGFNQTILYGKETTIEQIIETAKRFPMMSSHQVVIVKEAQHLTKQLDRLEKYLLQPMETTVLVIAFKYKTPDGRSKITKLLKKHSVYLESKPIYENKVPAFITERLAQLGMSISPEATRMLVEYLGTDLGKINNELSKLALVEIKDDRITPSIIEKNIGISKDFNNFELRKAIGARDVVKVQRIVTYFGENSKDNPLVLTTAQLYSLFAQLLKAHSTRSRDKNVVARAAGISPYFATELITAMSNYPAKYCSRAVKLIRDLDVRSKGVFSTSATDNELLKETLVNIMSR